VSGQDERGLEEWLTPVGLTSTFFRLLKCSTISDFIQVGKYCCGLVFCKTFIPSKIRSFAVKRTFLNEFKEFFVRTTQNLAITIERLSV
jgi:hypothetical protein